PRALVMMLHGTGLDGYAYLTGAGWADKSDAEGFLVVAPNALPRNPDQPQTVSNPTLWDLGENSDLPFLDAVLDDVAATFNVDPNRIYCVGHSSGGGMTFLMASKRPSKLAAVGIVAPFLKVSTSAEITMPTIYMQGTADPIVPIQGGPLDELAPPLDRTLNDWREVLASPGTRTFVSDVNGVQVSQFAECSGHATFMIYLIEGQGHEWPGGRVADFADFALGPSVDSLNATDTIWAFLAGQHK